MIHPRRALLRTGLCSLIAWGALAALGLPSTAHAKPPAQGKPLIVFMTDFGVIDDAVAICKGVMKSIAPGTEIIDLTHQVTPYSIADGARLLVRTSQYYPAGTVFVTVIDPGVGTSRKSIVLKTRRGQYFVLPDNGLVGPVAERDGVAGIREIRNASWQLAGSSSSTFHGRDVYSPVGAHLSRGEDYTQVGPALGTYTHLEVPVASTDARGIHATVIALDGPFGNLVTNVSREQFQQLGLKPGDSVHVSVGSSDMQVPYALTFGDVPTGTPLLFVDSRNQVSLAVNQGNFAEKFHILPPAPLVIFRP